MKRKKGKPAARSVDEMIEAGSAYSERGELDEAERCYREALAKHPDHVGVLSLLGLLLVERGAIDGAIDMLERAREIAPGFPPIQLALGSAYAAAGHDELAVTAMETAIKLDTVSTVPLERLAKHHITARRPREAIGMLRRILRREPDHAHARFLLAGLTGEQTGEADAKAVASPPPELIADLFDTYAGNFEQHLTQQLGYRVPSALAALIEGVAGPADGSWRIVDLGCGTGLVGTAFRAYARELIGVDLSPRMVARARQRGVYDQLYCEDLVATLGRVSDVDLIVAADVFIYVGMLEAAFVACAQVLRPRGLLAFSIELSAGNDVVLQPTLRYAHTDAYIRGLASTHGFVVERAEREVLRVDHGVPADGVLYVLRR